MPLVLNNDSNSQSIVISYLLTSGQYCEPCSVCLREISVSLLYPLYMNNAKNHFPGNELSGLTLYYEHPSVGSVYSQKRKFALQTKFT